MGDFPFRTVQNARVAPFMPPAVPAAELGPVRDLLLGTPMEARNGRPVLSALFEPSLKPIGFRGRFLGGGGAVGSGVFVTIVGGALCVLARWPAWRRKPAAEAAA